MLIHELRLKNLLSFDSEGVLLPLRQLNVLIGPNGSGKSNLIEAISLLRSAPQAMSAQIRQGGGIGEWLWKGQSRPTALIEATVESPTGSVPVRHMLSFTESAQRFQLVGERIENTQARKTEVFPAVFYIYAQNQPVLFIHGKERTLLSENLDPEQSILSQRKDPDQYPEITHLGLAYSKIRIYREWSFGRYTPPRQPQKPDQRNDYLEENCENLGLVLNRLRRESQAKKAILTWLKQLYDGIEDFDVSIEGGTVQVFLQENNFSIPATRLSDGTLRYLCLLAILCDPNPPPLVCIEEPELGLHPDVLPGLARLLKETSQKTQLIVTTHSDVLVDEMSEEPEAVVVCEKKEGHSEMHRLDSESLHGWLEKYRLGQLWIQGEIGGTRW